MRVNSLNFCFESAAAGSEGAVMSGEDLGDLLDFVLELVWYRRADRIAALEKEHTDVALILLVLAWYASAIFSITTSKKIVLVLPVPYTLCASIHHCHNRDVSYRSPLWLWLFRWSRRRRGLGMRRNAIVVAVVLVVSSGDNMELDSIAR